MIQRRLIIPRGDTGSFSIPYLKAINPGDVAVFTIFDIRTKTKMYQKLIAAEGDILNIAFTHGDTVNLKPGKYLWDIKFYTNPQIIDDELVNGDEVDSYYAGFSLPECEIRETGDTLLTSDDAPTSTISPESLNIINAAINEILNTKRAAVEAAETASSKADEAAESAESASNSASAANQSAELAEARVNEIENLSVEVSTGAERTNATATYTPSTGILSFEIPRGNTGNGIASCVLNADFTLTINYTDGTSMTTVPIRGDTPHLTIGEVTEGPNAIATITGTDANPVLNLTLPNANVPTRVSQLENDTGYLTEHQDISGKANVADLAAVATSGSYTDLGDKPYIPVKTSDLTNDSNYAIDANYVHTDNNYTTAEKNKLSGIAAGAEVNVNADWNATSGDAQILNKPTNVSDFINDAGYLTTETDPTVPAWAKAAQKPSYTAAEVGAPTVQEMNTAINTAIGNVNSFDIAVVQALPTEDISTHTIYLVPKTGETNDVYDEYVYINNAWEMVGNTQIDLSNYVQKTDYATASNAGVVKIAGAMGIDITNGFLTMATADHTYIQDGAHARKAIPPKFQHESVFYGLAKAAGADEKDSTLPVGQYTDTAKTAIKNMLGITHTLTVTVLTQDNVTVTGQTVYVRADNASGEVYATAAYEGQPVSFSVPDGFQYYVSVSDTLDHHFNPTTASGIVSNTDIAVTLQYSDLSTIRTAADIKAALNAGMDLTDLVGEQITCTKGSDTLSWDIVDYDETNKNVTLLLHDVFGTVNMVFEPVQALMWCENGLAAGSYTFTWQSTQCYFTLTTAIPAGGQLRATKSQFQTYASQDATATLETGTVGTKEIAGATDLGQEGQGLLNHCDRVNYGSNNFAESALLWWLNSDAAANTPRVPVTKFSRAYSYARPGFMNSLDADFVNCLDEVDWLCSTNNVYECPESLGGYTKDTQQAYTVKAKFGLASEMEIFGSYGGNADGSKVFDLYSDATAEERKKYRGTSAQAWWLRSPSWGHAYHERHVYSSGFALRNYASSSFGVVPACRISRTVE